MSKLGGYQILDLNGTEFESGTAQVVRGSMDALKYSNGKVIVVSGLNIGGTAYGDMGGYLVTSAGGYTVQTPSFTIQVAGEDAVTVTPFPQEEEEET